MRKKYGGRSSIEIKEDEISKINKLFYPKEKLSDFGKQAILTEIKLREEKKLAELTSSEQYHKMKNMEQDIEDLKKKTDFLNSDLNYFKTEYEFEEKHEKHGALERGLAKGRKEEPELMKVLDDMHVEMDRRLNEYSKKKFMEDGTSEEEWKKYNKEIQDRKRKLIHKKHA